MITDRYSGTLYLKEALLFRPESKQKTIFDHEVYLPAKRGQALAPETAGQA